MLDEQDSIDPRESFTAAVQADLDGFTFLGNGRCEIKNSEGERAGANFVESAIQQYKSFKLVSAAGSGTFMVRLDYAGGSDKNLHYVDVTPNASSESFNIRSVSMNNLRGLFPAGKSSTNLNFAVYGRP
ncbi:MULTISPECIES: hypothetical protein [Pseudomonas]|uniref:hypothetical protein n=1 Tax=Pseudomonas TaxID=286 RepID=UPI0005A5FFD1|nr:MULTISPECIES: hypothetical protein [Pseudomonas]AZD67627.1 hypothetical protein C4K17_3741 [Pseudomonas chlororaphis subsp. aurantiaca]AZD93082.1 hypothetical protein C4K13_3665 [Pseudomonas chlororaphis subsp. aureofaciens]KAB0532761.1 hypothetical protein F7R16_10975 [Pseudomonas chlororaphis subsp. aureofaciens]QIT23598.1 hypothetical protein HCN09_18315 [Pseudomonas chlororaphis subsp. aurantiaca]TSD26051.1 hypothetical protein FCE86_031815 [Pseudomonas sp. ATCC 13985]